MLSKLKDIICCPPVSTVGKDTQMELARRSIAAHEIMLPDLLCDDKNGKRYKPIQLLGRGTFGHCYKLHELGTKNNYAVKVINKTLMVSSLYTPMEMAAREISVQRHLQHTNIVRLESFFEDKQRIYMVLELCARGSLRELLQRHKRLSEYECRYYVRQLVQGLEYLHGCRIIHRDLKQENLLLTSKLQLKIADFGLATHLAHLGERKQMQCGTPDYTAPEVVAGQGYSIEVDIWAVGCILYELLHGMPPFDSDTLGDTISRVKRADYTIKCKLSTPVINLIGLLLQLQPHKRPSAAALLQHEFLRHTGLVKSMSSVCLLLNPIRSSRNLSQPQTLLAPSNHLALTTRNTQEFV